jgi:hypothetical protein
MIKVTISPDRKAGGITEKNMMDAKQKELKATARESYKSRMDDLRKLWENDCNGIEDDPELGNLNEYGLSLDYVEPDGRKRGYLCYLLSWGGPSSEFRFYMDEGLRLTKVEFIYMDWFVSSKITPQGKNLEVLTEMYESWRECETVAALIKKANEG